MMGVLFRVDERGDAIGHQYGPGRWRYDDESSAEDSGGGSSSGSSSPSDSVLLGGIHCCLLPSLETSISLSTKDWGEYLGVGS